MSEATITRPQIILKDSQGVTLSSHDHEFQAITAAEDREPGTFIIERPTATIEVT